MRNFARQYDGRFPQRAGCDPQKTMNYSLTHFFGILEKDIFKHLVAAMPFFCACLPSAAQDVAVKTNLLYDAALTLNLGAEVRLLPRWTMDVSGNLNAWAVNGHRWKHWVVQPEFRYWGKRGSCFIRAMPDICCMTMTGVRRRTGRSV